VTQTHGPKDGLGEHFSHFLLACVSHMIWILLSFPIKFLL